MRARARCKDRRGCAWRPRRSLPPMLAGAGHRLTVRMPVYGGLGSASALIVSELVCVEDPEVACACGSFVSLYVHCHKV
jgi:hypothetical protein